MTTAARILLILAHPDDETFASGGTICKYVEAGARVDLVTATRGDAGKTGDPPLCTREALAARREAELRAAAAILGIADVRVLEYRDRQLASAPSDQIRHALVGAIRRARPHLVITFDPHGANLHPDHVAISRFASDAVAAAADPRWYPDAGAAHVVQRLVWTPPVMPWELVKVPDVAMQPGIDFLIDVTPWRDRKVAALRAHATQHQSIEQHVLGRSDAERIITIEPFRQAWGPPLARRPSRDLLEGVSL